MTSTGPKGGLVALLDALAGGPEGAARRTLATACDEATVFEVFHPFNRFDGISQAADRFFEPLKVAFPDYEYRPAFAIEGSYENRTWVSTLGHLMGTFSRPWLGIPPTYGLAYLRLGVNALLHKGRIVRAYLLLDIPDLMAQAGFFPFRGSPGSMVAWPFPPADSGASLEQTDTVGGAETLRVVLDMQDGLGSGDSFDDHVATAQHSPHWHRHMGWYGPAGIGSTRGQRGFDDFHGAPFIMAFPDRDGYARSPGTTVEDPGHYIQAADGRFAVTSGWPSLHATHTGPGWLGLPPTGRNVEMRVADWYRLDSDRKIVDNWVLIDIPHILSQMGYDLFDEMRYWVDPSLPRWRP